MDVSAKNPQILQNVPNEEKFSGGITLQIKSWRQNLLKKGKRKKEQNSFFSLVLIRSGVCHIHQNSHTLSLQQGELAILPPDKMYAVEGYDADSIIETICLKPTLTAFFLCSEYVSEELETASGDTALNSLFFDEVRTILLNGTPDAAHLLSLSVYNFFRKMNECSGRFLSDVIFRLIQQINSHPEKDYSQNTLKARYRGFFFTLQRLFRKHHKCSIYEYVFQTRIGHINAFHSGLKRFLRPFNGVSTKHLPNYLNWHIWLLKTASIMFGARTIDMLDNADRLPDFTCLYVVFSLLFLNFIISRLYLHGADN